MQAIKDKLYDKTEMRRVKAEAREEEKMHKDLAKARTEVAHEIRLAKEAQGAMDLHVNKAVEKAQKHEAKYSSNPDETPVDGFEDPCGHSSSFDVHGYSNQMDVIDRDKATDAVSNTANPDSKPPLLE